MIGKIRYIKFKSEYGSKLFGYCQKHNIAFPDRNDETYIALNEKDEVVGVLGVKTMIVLEPFISDNPMIGYSLYRMVDGILQHLGINRVNAIFDDSREDLVKLYGKEGFKKIDQNRTILERKNYG